MPTEDTYIKNVQNLAFIEGNKLANRLNKGEIKTDMSTIQKHFFNSIHGNLMDDLHTYNPNRFITVICENKNGIWFYKYFRLNEFL